MRYLREKYDPALRRLMRARGPTRGQWERRLKSAADQLLASAGFGDVEKRTRSRESRLLVSAEQKRKRMAALEELRREADAEIREAMRTGSGAFAAALLEKLELPGLTCNIE